MTIKGKSAHPAVRRNQEDLLLFMEFSLLRVKIN